MSPYQFIQGEFPLIKSGKACLPVYLVRNDDLDAAKLPDPIRHFAKAAGFVGAEGSHLLVADDNGKLAGCLFGTGDLHASPFISGKLSAILPEGSWQLVGGGEMSTHLLAFVLGAYQFDRYKKSARKQVRLVVPDEAERKEIARVAAGVDLARDLINMPTNDLGPDQLEASFRALAAHYKAKIKVVTGEDLLKRGFPLIHAVGRASESAPRLLEMRWGKKGAKKITLVGKGVCFDTGGLDLKPASSMLLMKKDMGGAANVMGLALMIMDAKLEVDLRVLVPAVENSVAGNAFRPGDILTSRKGLTVQIDNTDAEGRLVLADALAYASEEKPDLIIDMATLTGAARVAVGPDLAPYYTDDEKLVSGLEQAAKNTNDPLWRMPLYRPYGSMLDTRAADLTNAPAGGFAGSITAALFLQRFVDPDIAWCHFDIFGWTPQAQPHAPIGGQAHAIRAIYRYLATI